MTREFTNGYPQRLPACNFLSQCYFYDIFAQKSCRFSLQTLTKFEAAKPEVTLDFCVWPLWGPRGDVRHFLTCFYFFWLQVPHSHIPYGESGSGLYSSKVLDTLAPIKELAPIALECVRTFPVTPGSVFTIADYGCADGGTSMPIIYSCVEELRKLHGNELEILIFYEDQPVNDFTSLFSFLQGRLLVAEAF